MKKEFLEITEKEKELLNAIRTYRKLFKSRALFTDYILYLRGYLEELLEDEDEP